MSRFDEKIVLIVGKPDEVAIATGKQLTEQGAVVVFCGDNSGGELAGASSKVGTVGSSDWIHSDLSGADDARQLVDSVMDKYGRLDVLVLNLAAETAMQKSNNKGLDVLAYQGVFSIMHVIEAALAVLQANGGGRIINIGSIDYLGSPEKAGLAGAYSSLFGLTRSLALKVAKDALTVNTVVLGDIEDATSTEEENASKLSSIPVKRLGQPADAAHAIRFFASGEAKYVTGQTFFVCGGKSIHYSMSI